MFSYQRLKCLKSGIWDWQQLCLMTMKVGIFILLSLATPLLSKVMESICSPHMKHCMFSFMPTTMVKGLDEARRVCHDMNDRSYPLEVEDKRILDILNPFLIKSQVPPEARVILNAKMTNWFMSRRECPTTFRADPGRGFNGGLQLNLTESRCLDECEYLACEAYEWKVNMGPYSGCWIHPVVGEDWTAIDIEFGTLFRADRSKKTVENCIERKRNAADILIHSLDGLVEYFGASQNFAAYAIMPVVALAVAVGVMAALTRNSRENQGEDDEEEEEYFRDADNSPAVLTAAVGKSPTDNSGTSKRSKITRTFEYSEITKASGTIQTPLKPEPVRSPENFAVDEGANKPETTGRSETVGKSLIGNIVSAVISAAAGKSPAEILATIDISKITRTFEYFEKPKVLGVNQIPGRSSRSPETAGRFESSMNSVAAGVYQAVKKSFAAGNSEAIGKSPTENSTTANMPKITETFEYSEKPIVFGINQTPGKPEAARNPKTAGKTESFLNFVAAGIYEAAKYSQATGLLQAVGKLPVINFVSNVISAAVGKFPTENLATIEMSKITRTFEYSEIPKVFEIIQTPGNSETDEKSQVENIVSAFISAAAGKSPAKKSITTEMPKITRTFEYSERPMVFGIIQTPGKSGTSRSPKTDGKSESFMNFVAAGIYEAAKQSEATGMSQTVGNLPVLNIVSNVISAAGGKFPAENSATTEVPKYIRPFEYSEQTKVFGIIQTIERSETPRRPGTAGKTEAPRNSEASGKSKPDEISKSTGKTGNLAGASSKSVALIPLNSPRSPDQSPPLTDQFNHKKDKRVILNYL